MTCSRCGRPRDRRDQTFCGDCGARLEFGPELVGHGDDLRARVGAIYAHADWGVLREHTPSSSGTATGMGCVALIAAGMTAGAAGIAYLAWQRFAPPQGWHWAVIGAAALVSVLALAWSLRGLSQLLAFLSAQLERIPVAVVGERRKVIAGRGGTEARPTHYVTLEREDGVRFEMQCTSRVAARVALRDVAVAYVRGGVLLDLVRVV